MSGCETSSMGTTINLGNLAAAHLCPAVASQRRFSLVYHEQLTCIFPHLCILLAFLKVSNKKGITKYLTIISSFTNAKSMFVHEV